MLRMPPPLQKEALFQPSLEKRVALQGRVILAGDQWSPLRRAICSRDALDAVPYNYPLFTIHYEGGVSRQPEYAFHIFFVFHSPLFNHAV